LVIPAGPLRASLPFQLGLVDCVVVNGASGGEVGGVATVSTHFKHNFSGTVLRATVKPEGEAGMLHGVGVVAYAGIGNPERFFQMLEDLGAEVLHKPSFADHHVISEIEAGSLLRVARERGARLVTTEKDVARLAGATGR